MVQHDLAERVGLKFQQIQKYETGANRISASRLYQIGEAFGVHPTVFFSGLEGKGAVPAQADEMDLHWNREAVDLITHYNLMPDSSRHAFFKLVRAIARGSEGDNLGDT